MMKRGADDLELDPKRQKMGPSKVLHCRNLPMYTTETELMQLVASFGRVVRTLVLHDKNQAFIQMETLDGAQRAVAAMEITPPTLRSKTVYVQFSNRQEVETKGGGGGLVGGMGGTPNLSADGGQSCVLILMITNVLIPVTLDNIHQICKPYGDVLRIITFAKGMDFQALVEFASVEQAANAKLFLDGKDLFQSCCHLRVSFSKRQSLVVKQNDLKSRDFTTQGDMTSPLGLTPPPMLGGPPRGIGGVPNMGMHQMMQSDRSPVVLVSKLDEAKCTPDILFTLFGVYGDVQRVKILYNKRDTALVQFATGQQADYARQNLTGCPLFGQDVHVANSKHTVIQLPREVEGKELTQDYTGSEFHRFRKKQYINPKNVCAPSAVLHVANVHESVNEQELRDLFGPHSPGMRPVVEFFKTNHSQAYISLGSVADGVNALISLHNYKLRNYPLRVSFSHKGPEQIANSDST